TSVSTQTIPRQNHHHNYNNYNQIALEHLQFVSASPLYHSSPPPQSSFLSPVCEQDTESPVSPYTVPRREPTPPPEQARPGISIPTKENIYHSQHQRQHHILFHENRGNSS